MWWVTSFSLYRLLYNKPRFQKHEGGAWNLTILKIKVNVIGRIFRQRYTIRHNSRIALIDFIVHSFAQPKERTKKGYHRGSLWALQPSTKSRISPKGAQRKCLWKMEKERGLSERGAKWGVMLKPREIHSSHFPQTLLAPDASGWVSLSLSLPKKRKRGKIR